jgi:hypothetical protein
MPQRKCFLAVGGVQNNCVRPFMASSADPSLWPSRMVFRLIHLKSVCVNGWLIYGKFRFEDMPVVDGKAIAFGSVGAALLRSEAAIGAGGSIVIVD